ncbi:MAG: hypothetical protein CMF80_08205 [Candidatus Marinimicrobia bacterium]|nr:hypothetical protein [Candidatus Neomarinimicrobiota bacterium]|tara:strand:+ start:1891 stop:2580 length:690 start_codon:yes stop_codon:yes gene_type:complete
MLPEDVKNKIQEYLHLNTYQIIKDWIKESARENLIFYLVFKPENREYIKDLELIYKMIKKYNAHQSDYESYCLRNGRNNQCNALKCPFSLEWPYEKYNPRSEFSPILIDILSSGLYLPFAKSTFPLYESKMIDDIKNIIRICPTSLLSDWGYLRCRYNLDPLYFACINNLVPIEVIKLLIRSGADLNYNFKFNGYSCHVLNDLDGCCMSRKTQIQNVFSAYGKILNESN